MTSAPAAYGVNPLFLDAGTDRLFAVSYEPRGKPRGAVLFCPPFAEEMNKARRMAALTARQLAETGYRVLVPDLYGTGDSAGIFADARLGRWVDNLEFCADWLYRQCGLRPDLWALRLGATLALELAARQKHPPARIVLWQPVVSGKSYVTQFLRLRVAAELTRPGGSTTVAALRSDIESGQTVEVAGYELSPQLVAALDSTDLRRAGIPQGTRVFWHELVSELRPEVSVVSGKVADAWRSAGAQVSIEPVIGEKFWSTVEVTLAPALIDHTVSCLAN